MEEKIIDFLDSNHKKICCIIFVIDIILFGILVFNICTNIQERKNILSNYNISKEDNNTFYFAEEDILNNFQNTLNILPNKITNKITKEKWKIITTEDFSIDELNIPKEKLSMGVCAGLTNKKTRIVYLKPMDIRTSTDCLYHEIGHIIDYHSYTWKFKNLYKKYKEIGYCGYNESASLQYAIVDKFEFFATTFKDYFLYPDYLKEKAPDVYEYFETNVNTT